MLKTLHYTHRYEYEVMIERILSKHIPCFKDVDVTEHIPHPYQAETKKKSVMVNIYIPIIKGVRIYIYPVPKVLQHRHTHYTGDK